MSNNRTINFSRIEQFHKEIATALIELKGFYRFDFQELNNAIPGDIEFPVLMLEAPSSELFSETKMVSNFNRRNISFLVIDHAGAADDYTKKTEVLTDTEGIALDIISYLKKCAIDRSHFLCGLFDINTVRIEKVGPLFDNMHGWNILYEIKAQETMCFVPEKWNF